MIALPVSALAAEGGTWTAVVHQAEKRVELEVHPDEHSSFGLPVAFGELAGFTGRDGETRFSLTREAGTLRFDGKLGAGRGAGLFTFEPDAHYADEMARLGFPEARSKNSIALAVLDVGPARVREYRALGLEPLGWDELFALCLHGATPAFIRELRAAGLEAKDSRRVVALRIHGVTPAYEKELADAGVTVPDEAALIELRIHGVTADLARQMQALGLGTLGAKDLERLRIHGVTPEYVEQMKELKVGATTAQDYVQLRIYGVTPDFVRELRAAGYEELGTRDLVKLRIHGVDGLPGRKGGAEPGRKRR